MHNPTIANERQQTINGLDGRYLGATVRHDEKPGCFCMQRWVRSRTIDYYGEQARFTVELRFDDDCRNGHNSFAITGDIERIGGRKRDRFLACGCLHDDIAEHFPELKPLIKWHLCTTDGPMHYVANTIYFAGDRDSRGLLKGEPSQAPHQQRRFVTFGENPIRHTFRERGFTEWLESQAPFDLEVIEYTHEKEPKTFRPRYTFGGFGAKWHACPFDTLDEAVRFLKALQTCSPMFNSESTLFGQGKERELEAARCAAIWPDASDAELCLPGAELTERLNARLPALLAEFRADMEACGFLWEAK